MTGGLALRRRYDSRFSVTQASEAGHKVSLNHALNPALGPALHILALLTAVTAGRQDQHTMRFEQAPAMINGLQAGPSGSIQHLYPALSAFLKQTPRPPVTPGPPRGPTP